MFAAAPLLLYMTAEPFEYRRSDWPASVRMVGPSCWEPAAAPPDWLPEITRPLVLVTTSSEFQDDGRLVRTALDALATEEVAVVASRQRPTLRSKSQSHRRGRLRRLLTQRQIRLARRRCARR